MNRDQRRKLLNSLMMGVLWAMALIAITPLVSLFVYIIQKGAPALNLELLTELPRPMGESGGGLAHALLGTLELVLLAAVIAVPWGIAIGLFLSESQTHPIARACRLTVELLSSIPSIVVGLFVYALIVVPLKGFSAFAGAAALSVIMLPTVAKATEEVLRLVPSHVREAGLALGLPRWVVSIRIVLRAASGGILTGVMLAVARVSGETAPLLFTALTSRFFSFRIDEPIASLPVHIYTYAISPNEEWHAKAWAASLLLVLFVFTLNLLTRVLFQRTSKGHS